MFGEQIEYIVLNGWFVHLIPISFWHILLSAQATGYGVLKEEQGKEIYRNLTEYCGKRAEKFGIESPVFEPFEVFDKCCLDIRIEHLISINDDDQFVRACFMKILDNLGSPRWKKIAVTPLKLGVLSREGFIIRLIKSSAFVDNKTRFKL